MNDYSFVKGGSKNRDGGILEYWNSGIVEDINFWRDEGLFVYGT
jgi:hypothetical protein